MKISRRNFICDCGLCCLGLALHPVWDAIADEQEIDVGVLSKFDRDGVWNDYARYGFLLVRNGARLYALSNRCTHSNGKIVTSNYKAISFACTKHKGVFDLEGNPIGGPPDTALVRFRIVTREDGNVIVDLKKTLNAQDAESEILVG